MSGINPRKRGYGVQNDADRSVGAFYLKPKSTFFTACKAAQECSTFAGRHYVVDKEQRIVAEFNNGVEVLSKHITTKRSLRGWTKKLTKEEMRHLKEQGIKTTDELLRQILYIDKCLNERPNSLPQHVVCWDCLMIKRKLEEVTE